LIGLSLTSGGSQDPQECKIKITEVNKKIFLKKEVIFFEFIRDI